LIVAQPTPHGEAKEKQAKNPEGGRGKRKAQRGYGRKRGFTRDQEGGTLGLSLPRFVSQEKYDYFVELR